MVTLDQVLEQLLTPDVYALGVPRPPLWPSGDEIRVYNRPDGPIYEVYTQQRLESHPFAHPALMQPPYTLRNYAILRMLAAQRYFWMEGDYFDTHDSWDMSKIIVLQTGSQDLAFMLTSKRAIKLKHSDGYIVGRYVDLRRVPIKTVVELEWEGAQ